MRVLLIEDDVTTSAKLEAMLQGENFTCDIADLGEQGVERGKLGDYDIIILDLMLPDIDGYQVLQQLRAARVPTPVLILSGLDKLDHKIKGLGFGADDFLTKPFEPRELIARIHAVVRRSKGYPAATIRTGKTICTPEGTSRSRLRSSMCTCARCGRSSRGQPVASITSRRCGAADGCCATR